jgi:hypothetical protein
MRALLYQRDREPITDPLRKVLRSLISPPARIQCVAIADDLWFERMRMRTREERYVVYSALQSTTAGTHSALRCSMEYCSSTVSEQ